ALLTPSHVSATSQSPAAARQTAVLFPSAGQAVPDPSQTSSSSQTPAAARQSVPAFPAACWHASFVPSHRSVVQTFPSSAPAVPLVSFASAGQASPDPVQLSATSHSPAAARQTIVADLNPSAGHASLEPSQLSLMSQAPAAGRQTVPAAVFVSS